MYCFLFAGVYSNYLAPPCVFPDSTLPIRHFEITQPLFFFPRELNLARPGGTKHAGRFLALFRRLSPPPVLLMCGPYGRKPARFLALPEIDSFCTELRLVGEGRSFGPLSR